MPALNAEAVAQVGDTIRSKVAPCPDAQLSKILSPVNHKGYSIFPYAISIPAGELIALGSVGPGSTAGTFYEAQQPLQFNSHGITQVRGGIFVSDLAGQPAEIYWHSTDLGIPLADPDPSIQFEKTIHEDWHGDSFKREIVYNGRSGGTIKILYREFNEDRIRPAFSQEVSYDLEQGKTIGFKTSRFQVLDADNTQIKYVVLHHFD